MLYSINGIHKNMLQRAMPQLNVAPMAETGLLLALPLTKRPLKIP